MMNRHIANIRRIRIYTLDQVKELSLEKLNIVPHGFNNNIIWNLGHLLAAQQSICYVKMGLLPVTPDGYFEKFKPGSRPDRFFESDEVDEVRELLISQLDSLQADYHRHVFDKYVPWTTRYGFELLTIDEALDYLFFHEGLHLGVIHSIKKLVQK
ncbi:MAG: DinB family protein [Flavitalea sp.]